MPEQMDRKNILAMKLLHYFITEKNYNPIILQGAENEIWLENMDSDYKIVRIVSNHIINDEQLNFDLFKTKHVVRKIKRKTFSLTMNVLSIFTDLDEDVKLQDEKNMNFISLYDEQDLSKYKYIYETFPDISKKMKFSEEGFQLFMKITTDINRKNKEDAIKVDEVFKKKIPYITYGLILINVIIYILMYLMNYERYFIENYSVWGYGIIKNGEFYRLITGAFLHGDIFHLLFNMYALFVIGSQIESFMGKAKYLVIYFFSAIVGSLFSIVLNNNISIGASGAIFGLLGSLLYFGYHYRVYLGGVIKSQILPLIIINLAIGFLGENIDNFAHIGGLVGGILITMAIGVKYKSTISERINGTIVSALLVGFLVFMALNYVNFS
ncbi:MAG: rhomboid family intramembrane serine protease [Bacilli bacterium]|nr:rhomboid family intramembrane serine protease [Bacilli bacterium]